MKITKDEVLKIAAISRIAIHEEEIQGFVKQLEDVLSYAECVKKLAEETIDQPSNTNVNFFREDVVAKFDSEGILAQSPEREENYFVVPKILDTK